MPRGSKYPMFKVSGPKNHVLNGFWDQSPQILGTCTLWVGNSHIAVIRINSKLVLYIDPKTLQRSPRPFSKDPSFMETASIYIYTSTCSIYICFKGALEREPRGFPKGNLEASQELSQALQQLLLSKADTSAVPSWKAVLFPSTKALGSSLEFLLEGSGDLVSRL